MRPESPEAWHANEVLKDGPLIHDIARCEQIPETSRGNDTKVGHHSRMIFFFCMNNLSISSLCEKEGL